MKLNGGTHRLADPKRRFSLRGDPDYISESEKAELIERARRDRLNKPKSKSLMTFPGYHGAPSELPGKKWA